MKEARSAVRRRVHVVEDLSAARVRQAVFLVARREDAQVLGVATAVDVEASLLVVGDGHVLEHGPRSGARHAVGLVREGRDVDHGCIAQIVGEHPVSAGGVGRGEVANGRPLRPEGDPQTSAARVADAQIARHGVGRGEEEPLGRGAVARKVLETRGVGAKLRPDAVAARLDVAEDDAPHAAGRPQTRRGRLPRPVEAALDPHHALSRDVDVVRAGAGVGVGHRDTRLDDQCGARRREAEQVAVVLGDDVHRPLGVEGAAHSEVLNRVRVPDGAVGEVNGARRVGDDDLVLTPGRRAEVDEIGEVLVVGQGVRQEEHLTALLVTAPVERAERVVGAEPVTARAARYVDAPHLAGVHAVQVAAIHRRVAVGARGLRNRRAVVLDPVVPVAHAPGGHDASHRRTGVRSPLGPRVRAAVGGRATGAAADVDPVLGLIERSDQREERLAGGGHGEVERKRAIGDLERARAGRAQGLPGAGPIGADVAGNRDARRVGLPALPP